MRKFAPALLALAIAACSTTNGVREFQTYAIAFAEVVEASDTVLNEMAAEERASTIKALDGNSISDKLDPANITTFAPSADPPFVASLRFAVQSVASLNSILLAYAEGRALDQMKDDLKELQTEGLGFRSLKTTDPIAKQMAKEIAILGEVLDVAIGIGSREAFRKELAKSAGKIDYLLEVVLSHSTIAFRTLTYSEFKEYHSVRHSNATKAAALREEIATEREMLAEWLHLIQLSRKALKRAVAASASKPGLEDRLVDTALLTGDLRARADRIKRLAAKH